MHNSLERGDEQREQTQTASEDIDRPAGNDAASQPGEAAALAGDAEIVDKSGLFDRSYYLEANPDVAIGGGDALDHYLRHGAAEGRNPNPYFHSRWYLETNTDVAKANINPLLHYILYGERENRPPCAVFDPRWYRAFYLPASNRGTLLAHYLHDGRQLGYQPNPFFDTAFYLRNNPDVAKAGIDPALHFYNHGFQEGRDPAPDFDMVFYRRTYLRGNASINPLIHYAIEGHKLGNHTRSPISTGPSIANEVRRFTAPGPHFEERDASIARLRKPAAKCIAFYLPQFHAIPENDRWWGKGFTEWRSVGRGLPRFEGHFQPRLPGELGYYDLTDPTVMPRQVAMAREAGLAGFCFYFYRFNRTRLIEAPIEMFLANERLDMPFCIMWANENWTRQWDGLESEILIKQDYREEDDEELVADLDRHFSDARYIRIGGRPLFIIYRPSLIPDTARTLVRWRGMITAKSGADPMILMVQGFGEYDPRAFGLDGAIEFPPHKFNINLPTINERFLRLDPNHTGAIQSYDDLADRAMAVPTPDYPLVRAVMPSWDNDSRRQGRGTTFHGSTPRKYELWLKAAVDHACRHPVGGESLVFINAWNEWAEAAYLEPDVHFGGAYLNATARALTGTEKIAKTRIVLVGHDAHRHGAQMLLLNMARTFKFQFAIDVSIVLLAGGELLDSYFEAADVHVVDGDEGLLERILGRLAQSGYGTAIVNTTVAGTAVAICKRLGYRVATLVHELPKLIEEFGLAKQAQAIREHSDKIVFAAKLVADGFAAAVGAPLEDIRALVRPQGLYTEWTPDAEGSRRLRSRLGLADGAKLVLNVGYADFRKGFDIFLSVAKIMALRRGDVHFAWLGNSTAAIRDWLLADIAGTQLEGRFHMLGHDPHPVPTFEAADAFFLSSREDPFPTVVLEAMRAGLPIVALKHGGGFTGLVAEHGTLVDRNDLNGITDAIGAAVDLAGAEREAKAQAQRDVIGKEFRFDDYLSDLLKLLDADHGTVSIAVPNYNYARYLPSRLDSIFAQTYPILETLVLDDGSTDDSIAVLDEYRARTKRRFELIGNDVNSGSAYKQWEKACSLARGEFVWIAEADDIAEAEFLQECMLLMRRSRCAFVFCDSAQIDQDGGSLADSYGYYYDTVEPGCLRRSFVMPGTDFARRYLSIRNLILNASGVLWRREALAAALEATAPRRRGMSVACDWMMYLSAASRPGSIGYVARPLNVHRRHRSSATHSLDAERHVAEIEEAHGLAKMLLGTDRDLDQAQAAYIAELRRQFGLKAAMAMQDA